MLRATVAEIDDDATGLSACGGREVVSALDVAIWMLLQVLSVVIVPMSHYSVEQICRRYDLQIYSPSPPRGPNILVVLAALMVEWPSVSHVGAIA